MEDSLKVIMASQDRDARRMLRISESGREAMIWILSSFGRFANS